MSELEKLSGLILETRVLLSKVDIERVKQNKMNKVDLDNIQTSYETLTKAMNLYTQLRKVGYI